jgi:hypothetical protein
MWQPCCPSPPFRVPKRSCDSATQVTFQRRSCSIRQGKYSSGVPSEASCAGYRISQPRKGGAIVFDTQALSYRLSSSGVFLHELLSSTMPQRQARCAHTHSPSRWKPVHQSERGPRHLLVLDRPPSTMAKFVVQYLPGPSLLLVTPWLCLAANAGDVEEKCRSLNAVLPLDPENEPATLALLLLERTTPTSYLPRRPPFPVPSARAPGNHHVRLYPTGPWMITTRSLCTPNAITFFHSALRRGDAPPVPDRRRGHNLKSLTRIVQSA